MKNLVSKSKAGQFLTRKCAESNVWAWGVTATSILATIGVCML